MKTRRHALPTRRRLHILVSAGPTREYIDPVRFISNPSSGRMGYAVAAAAVQAGHRVTLVSGPVALTPPAGVRILHVERVREMQAALRTHFSSCDALIMTAAVGDYQAARPRTAKLHKTGRVLTLRLVRTPDILASLPRRRRQIVVGFAAETDAVLASAARKLAAKHLDMIVANDVSAPDAGFGQAALRAALLYRDGRVRDLGRCGKRALARLLVREVEHMCANRAASSQGVQRAAQKS